MKTCATCGIEKPKGEFYQGEGRCKVCCRARAKAYRDAHPDKRAATWKAWYQAQPPEAHRERERRWRKANPDKVREAKKRDAERHRDRIRETARRGRERNLEQVRAYHREYLRNMTPEQRARKVEHTQRYRARMRGVEAERVDRLAIYERDGGICWLCEKPVPQDAFHLDHVIPVSKGGPHMAWNLRVTHRACNVSKNDRLVPFTLPVAVYQPEGPVPTEGVEALRSLDLAPGESALLDGRWLVVDLKRGKS